MQARVVIFGKHVDNDVLYHAIANQSSTYSSLYLSNFLSFHTLNKATFRQRFLWNCASRLIMMYCIVWLQTSFLHRCFAATGQRKSPDLQSCNGCYRAKRVWINTTSCLFAWPSSKGLLPIPELEKGYPRMSFPVWRKNGGSWGVGQWKGPWLFQFLNLNTVGLSASH